MDAEEPQGWNIRHTTIYCLWLILVISDGNLVRVLDEVHAKILIEYCDA